MNHVAHSGIKYIQKRNLPTFDELQSKYRRYDEISDSELFKEYGGDMQDALDYNDKKGRNTYACALRVSATLVDNGELINKKSGITLTAKNGNHYIVNTEKLNDYLTANYELSDTSMDQSSYSGRKGIIFFRIGYSDASGHITLWDGNNVLGGSYDASEYFSKANAVYFYETN